MTLLEERLDIVEERTDRLETLFGQFMSQTGIALRRIDRSIERMEAVIAEMKAEAAKDRAEAAKQRAEDRAEVARQQAEAAKQRAEDRAEVARQQAEAAKQRAEDRADFQQYRAQAQAEFEQYRAQADKERREMNKRWGELANKMGTIVEDIIAPSLRRMADEELGCGPERFFAERLSLTRSDDPGRGREFDALYIGTQAVLLNETKTTPRSEDVREFVAFLRDKEFALYFPEYAHLPIVPVFSSLHIPPNLVTYLTRQGIYAVAMGDEAMQILNRVDVDAASAV